MTGRISAAASAIAGAALFVGLTGMPALAQPIDGVYLGAGAGWNWLQDSDLDVRGTAAGTLRAVIPSRAAERVVLACRHGPARKSSRLVSGFAVLATPAEYSESGIQSFLGNQDSTIWQRDLVPETARIAARITRYNPDGHWQNVAE